MAVDKALEGARLPFDEAIQFFQQKVALPTQAWTDLKEAMHDRAFVVAGVTRQDVLVDLQTAVLKAIQKGTTLEEFRRDFDQAVMGKWEPKQDRGWRTRVIYETNIRTAYAAGRWTQLQEMKDAMPFWEYRHGDSLRPRPEHLAWNGLVLSADDPWWQAHYPPNGWGCRCSIVARSEGDLARAKKGVDKPPPVQMVDRPWGSTGQTLPTPRGVDPGWGYAPGQQAFQWPPASPLGGKPAGPKASWTPLDKGTWETAGRPRTLAPRKAEGGILPKVTDPVAALRQVLGGPEKLFRVGAGDWEIPLVVNAERLGGHLPADRAPFMGLLPDALKPQEVWAQFAVNEQGRVALRWRMVTAVEDRGKKLALVAEGNDKGVLEALTFIPINNTSELNKLRVGRLVSWT